MPRKARTYTERLKAARGERRPDREYDRRRARDPALTVARQIRDSRSWRKVRAAKLKRDPLCEECRVHGVTERASTVDHVVGLAIAPQLWKDPDNLRSLCTTCHAAKSAKERR